MNKTLMEKVLTEALPDCQFIIENQDNKYAITAKGKVFAGLNTVERHKLIYQQINPFIEDGSVHAVSIKALTPEERFCDHPGESG